MPESSTPPQSAPVVLLHGGGIGPWMWDAVIGLLHECRCVAPELPGHGADAAALFSFAEAREQVVRLIDDKFAGEPVHLVGLSLGGQLALDVTASHPELVRSVVVSGANAVGLPGTSLVGPSVRVMMPLRRLRIVQRATLRTMALEGAMAAAYLADSARSTAAGVTAILRASSAFRVSESLSQFSGPALVLVGEKEPKLMRRSAGVLATALPQADVRLVRGAAHTWPLSNPELFAQTLRSWMTGGGLPETLGPLLIERPATVER